MDFLPFLCSLLSLLVISGYALESANYNMESYWHSTLPNTQLPNSLRTRLQRTRLQRSANQVEGKVTYVGVGKNAIKIEKTPQGKETPFVGPENYGSAVSNTIRIEPGVTTFFVENDLFSGKKMPLHFTKTTTGQACFLPRKVSDSIPFSSKKFPEILNHFSVKPDSIEAKIMKQTIEECEQPAIKGEDKYCATSLESLIDFSVSKLGKKVQVYTSEVDKEVKQVYSIEPNGVKKIGERAVICHSQNYAYAVFYCHEVPTTRTYAVSFVGADGTKVKAVAACHRDTRFWSAENLVFKILKVQPGTVPICHFFPSDNLVWVPN